MGSLGFPDGLLRSPSSLISIASASLLVRFWFPWVPLYAARVAPRFYFKCLCLPLGSIWVPLGSLMGCQGRPQVLFQSPLPPSWFDVGSLGFPYGLVASPSCFISITSASLSVGFEFLWVPLWAARVALRFYFDYLCLSLGWLWVPLGSLMSC